MNTFEHILCQFPEIGTVKEVAPLTSGIINQTYLVKTAEPASPDYILQRINHQVFTDVPLLQHNIELVTQHIRRKLEERGEKDIDRKVLRFVPSAAVTPESSYLVGLKFGEFEAMLADLPETLGETIPDFHNMEFRLRQLNDAVAADAAGRLHEVKSLVDDILRDAEEMCCAERLYREGKLPKRVCHCDTKVSNMLFDKEGNVLCVIDLDTTMPSFVFSDFGDFLRSAANTTREDDPDIEKVSFNQTIFEAFAKGYIESAKAFLTPCETELLPYAVALFPYMQAVRFLTDYINGDTYYRTDYPAHNLDRTRNQYKLYCEVQKAMPAMKQYIASLL